MKFKFKIQQYQTDAAGAVCDVFSGQAYHDSFEYLRDAGTFVKTYRDSLDELWTIDAAGYSNAELDISKVDILSNIQSVQKKNQLFESTQLFDNLGACQLDVEMETGTGKTYVYTKTMFELNKRYGWTKFIIVVPSVAIREGVYKSLQTTEKHFFDQYGKTLRYFIYNSSRLNELDAYSESSDINVMIINMQAFNSSFKEGAKNSVARIIFDERDEFGSRRPIDVIAANNPILILDEPQKMGKKSSATQKALKSFNPLFCLNYSATHEEKHNTVYILDAIDAYNQRLVKKIQPKCLVSQDARGTDGYLYLQDIVISKNKAPQARIEFNKLNKDGSIKRVTQLFDEGDSIYDASGLKVYEGCFVESIDATKNDFLGEVTVGGIKLEPGLIVSDSYEADMRRVQIRETIKSHFQKEKALFERGIKCLSLFFIDQVSKYRTYDDDGNPQLGDYARIFEEEYNYQLERELEQPSLDPRYHEYLKSMDVCAVHNGYFSVDKNGRSIDSKISRGEQSSSDESAYNLILKNKERLLSFEEPTRFIFSHSALSEGWDNPNIFQICFLKELSAETRRRQEIGRGLRLAVNTNGDRQDYQALGDDIYSVNTLTVVAPESYESFTSSYQDETRKTLSDRPHAITAEYFEKLVFVNDQDEELRVTKSDSSHLRDTLLIEGLIDMEGVPTEKFTETKRLPDSAIEKLPEHLKSFVPSIEKAIGGVQNPEILKEMLSNGFKPKVTSFDLNENFNKKEFQALWNKINSKYSYSVSFDSDELVKNSINAINDRLSVRQNTYKVYTGEQSDTLSRSKIETTDMFERTSIHTDIVSDIDDTDVKYDLVGEVAEKVKITRKTAARILAGISSQKFNLFRVNPEQFIARVSKLIDEQRAGIIVEGITYHKLEDNYESDIFTCKMPEDCDKLIDSLDKCIQDYVVPDSTVERKFVKDLEVHEEVVVYAKLPREFKIPTPVGSYAPDWAIAFKDEDVNHIYFVAETKGSSNTLDLRAVENSKISCTRKLFEQCTAGEVKYDCVSTYEDLLALVRE